MRSKKKQITNDDSYQPRSRNKEHSLQSGHFAHPSIAHYGIDPLLYLYEPVTAHGPPALA
jgi:hypothetical protein